MFGHLLKYGIKSLLREKEIVFWTLIFPFALATFMYMAFSNLFDTTEAFHVVPVAIVQKEENQIYDTMLTMISEEGENQLLEIQKVEEDKAQKLLEDESVEGIIYVGDTLSLKVKESGMEESLLQMVLNQFLQYKETVTEIAQKNPDNMMKAIAELSSQIQWYENANSTEGNQDNVINFFYAIFAMTCLFASYAGCDKIIKIQANTSALGQRRNVAPTHKFKSILADFVACELLQYVIICLLFVFMKYVLKLDLGDKVIPMLLLLLLGTSFGIMLGIFVGSLPRIGEGAKVGILTSVSLALCVMCDLMAQGVKDLIEHTVPVINDINPAALISDSFYALNVYDNYERFGQNMMLLGGETILLAVICYFMIRRTRHASL